MVGAASFEASLRQLARDLRARGHLVLAAFLLEVVPEAGAVRTGEQRGLIADRLRRLATAEDLAPQLRASVVQLADLAADAIALRGHGGTVWIAWEGHHDDGSHGPRPAETLEPGYWVSWQADREDEGAWWEDGPWFTDLRKALVWARERTDAIIVRPAWDEGTHYWAGRGADPRHLPPLDESRA